MFLKGAMRKSLPGKPSSCFVQHVQQYCSHIATLHWQEDRLSSSLFNFLVSPSFPSHWQHEWLSQCLFQSKEMVRRTRAARPLVPRAIRAESYRLVRCKSEAEAEDKQFSGSYYRPHCTGKLSNLRALICKRSIGQFGQALIIDWFSCCLLTSHCILASLTQLAG